MIPRFAVKEISDLFVRENFQKLQAFLDKLPITQEGFAAIELYVTDNVVRRKIPHGLGLVPKDVLATRLVAPSGAKLTFHYSEFTKDEIVVTVSGLSGALSARLLVGSFGDLITNSSGSGDNETQEMKAKF